MNDKCQTMDTVFDCHVTSPELSKIYPGLAEMIIEKNIL